MRGIGGNALFGGLRNLIHGAPFHFVIFETQQLMKGNTYFNENTTMGKLANMGANGLISTGISALAGFLFSIPSYPLEVLRQQVTQHVGHLSFSEIAKKAYEEGLYKDFKRASINNAYRFGWFGGALTIGTMAYEALANSNLGFFSSATAAANSQSPKDQPAQDPALTHAFSP